jgi:hypothetical protein
MHLVGVQRDHVSGHTGVYCPAVLECLHP